METRHDVTVGQEVQAAAETTQIPVVPETPDAGQQQSTWRSSLGVALALVVTFVVVTLVGL
ncbi:hypothetical protein [Brachybacterium sp.]|uniref:hypothetical protein n=1 Tax=Brachybacterium sp. TaxID=1891286 RepID=UPI002ED414F2